MYNYLNLQVNKIPLENKSIKPVYEIMFTGDFNYQNCHEFTAIMTTMLKKNIRRIVLNLHELARIDSAGIGLIIHHSQKFESGNFEFIIVQAKNQVLSSFNNISLNKFVKIFDTKDEGVGYFLNNME